MEHTEIGKVVQVFHRKVQVRIDQPEGCSACGVKSSCHATSDNSKKRIVTALDPFGLKPGQRVKINLESKNLIKASIIIFVFPLVGLLTGSAIGSRVAEMNELINYLDMFAIIGGLLGMGITIFGLKIHNKKIEKTYKYYPSVVEIM